MKKYSLWQKLTVWWCGRCFIGWKYIKRSDGTECPAQIYLTKCDTHGLFEDIQHNFEPHDYYICPECKKEK